MSTTVPLPTLLVVLLFNTYRSVTGGRTNRQTEEIATL